MSLESQSPHKRYSPVKVTLIITVLAVAFGTNGGIYNIPVANNLKPLLVEYINDSRPMNWLTSGNESSLNAATLFGFVVSSFTAGSAIGTLLSPTLAEYLGRRPGLLISATLNAFGSFICFFYLHFFELIFIGRLLMGVSLGMGMPLASTFIVEVSPLNRRGQLNALLQTAFGVGDILGMVVTVPELLGSVNLSPYALSLTIIPSIINFTVMCFAHESPRFLILKRNRLQEAIKALKYYQNDNDCDQIVEEIQAEGRNHVQDATGCGSCSNFTKKPFRLACFLWATCALVGIALVLAYSTDAFVDNGVPQNIAQWSTVALGAVNILGSFLAISLMETWGRKPLLITGLMGCFSSITIYTVASWILRHYPTSRSAYAYIVVPCLLFFILFFSLYGAASATLAAEICPQLYRSAAISSGVFSTMTMSTILISIYEPIKERLGYSWVFLPSSVISVLIGLYLGLAVPETKGRTLSELCEQFRN